MPLLVVGASGYLGGEVCRQAVAAGARVVGTYHRAPGAVDGVDWQPLDVTRPGGGARAGRRGCGRTRWSNTASVYGDWAVCADGAGHVAPAAVEAGARLVHLSSDALHAGRAEPYADDERAHPGLPVRGGEGGGRDRRTAGRAGRGAGAYLADRRGRAEQADQALPRRALRGIGGSLFSDEVRCPVDVTDLAAAVLELVESDYAGLLNVAGPDPVSRAELGRLVARRYGLDPARLAVDHDRRRRPAPPGRGTSGQLPRRRPAEDPAARRTRAARRLNYTGPRAERIRTDSMHNYCA